MHKKGDYKKRKIYISKEGEEVGLKMDRKKVKIMSDDRCVGDCHIG